MAISLRIDNFHLSFKVFLILFFTRDSFLIRGRTTRGDHVPPQGTVLRSTHEESQSWILTLNEVFNRMTPIIFA